MKLIDLAMVTTALTTAILFASLICLMIFGFSLMNSDQDNHKDIKKPFEDIEDILIHKRNK